jgi:hypothetical protein
MKRMIALTAVLTLAGFFTANGAGLGPPHPAFYVDGELYRTVGTPTSLPDKGPFDGLYGFSDEILQGQTPVAESAPGDQDYNGGRWERRILEFTEEGVAVHDPDGDGVVNFELTSWEEVEEHIALGHLEVIGEVTRFECPVIPKH